MNTFLVIAVFIAALALFVFVSYTFDKSKSKRLAESGITSNQIDNCHMYVHYFLTRVDSIAAVEMNIDRQVLRQMKIKMMPYPQEGKIVFRRHRKLFVAELASGNLNESGRHVYTLIFLRWKESVGLIEDMYGPNALLTAVGRAFNRMDPETEIRYEAAEITKEWF